MKLFFAGLVCATLFASQAAHAQSAAEMARKLQDPLANISALVTDNDIYIGTGDGEASTVLQFQPVYAVNFDDFNLIPRGVIPVVGLAPEAKLPGTGEPADPGGSTNWGLGDSVAQLFWSPKTQSPWKWGVGPQFSVPTSTRDELQGPGWGAGVVGVAVGNLNPETSVAVIGGQLWGQDSFSVTLVQPMIFYNVPSVPGMAFGYNGAITYDHNISSGDKLQLPLGAVFSQTTDIGGGHGIDMLLGAYVYPVKPDGGPDWSLKFGVSWLIPR